MFRKVFLLGFVLVALVVGIARVNEEAGVWIWPVDTSERVITSSQDVPRKYGPHEGVDIRARPLTRALAVADGVVVTVNVWNGKMGGMQAYGNYVAIQLDSSHTVLYAHLSDFIVTVGQRVRQGEVIGRTGYTGNARTADGRPAPHLHIHATHPDAPPAYVFDQRIVNIQALLPKPDKILLQ